MSHIQFWSVAISKLKIYFVCLPLMLCSIERINQARLLDVLN